MWLTSSSIGRKFVMALTGCCLVLFLTFHVLMNSVALIWPTAYNQICELLGANWYALVASMGLAALFIIHIVYAVWLTIQNRAARGADRYAVTARQPQVEWSSKNMLVLGFVVIAFIAVHMIQFWSKMQLVEAMHTDVANLPQVNGVPAGPALGTLFLQAAFQEIWTPIVYVLAFVALWFHMNHGFWSMLHTVGFNNNIWMNRWKAIGCWWTTIVVGLFILQVGVFTYQANQKFYLEDEALQEQYAEYWYEQGAKVLDDMTTDPVIKEKQAAQEALILEARKANDYAKFQELIGQFNKENKELYKVYQDRIVAISKAIEKQCPKVDEPLVDINYIKYMTARQQLTQLVGPEEQPVAPNNK